MENADLARRLASQERLLHAILTALAPPEEEGSGFDDLVEALTDLTEAIADVAAEVRALRSDVSARCPQPGAIT